TIFQKATLKLLQDQIITLENFQKSYDLYAQQFQKLTHGFVDSEVPIDFIKYLEDMAERDNLEIIIAPLGFNYDSKKKDALPILDFQANVSGTLSNCFRFLERLENSPWFLEIKQVNLEGTGISSSKNKLSDTTASLSLNFSAFSYATSSSITVK
ncbi:MAG: hypothetical protein PHN39_03230, partial [Candidatus Pacebacteria bacterium]|nr:hypothetical protein [Candidatus Paceibacterota bacterium]